MKRQEILKLDEEKVLKLISEKFDKNIDGFDDTEHLAQAWKIVEVLIVKGWRMNIIADDKVKQVDAILMDGGPETIFAQYGKVPVFDSITEGISKVALIIFEERLN